MIGKASFYVSYKISENLLAVSEKNRSFATGIGFKTTMIMNTIAIDSNIYQGAEMYAKLHNISVRDVIEKGVTLLVGKLQAKKDESKAAKLEQAMALMDTMMVKGGKPVPADANGLVH